MEKLFSRARKFVCRSLFMLFLSSTHNFLELTQTGWIFSFPDYLKLFILMLSVVFLKVQLPNKISITKM